MKTSLLPLLAAGLMLSGVAQAQQVISYFAEIPQRAADWTKTMRLPGFNSSLGTLTQVRLSFTGEVRQSVFAENTGSDSSPYDLTSIAWITLREGDGCGSASLAFGPAILHHGGKAGAFDGVLDFSGTSGGQFAQNHTLSGIYLDPRFDHYLNRPSVDFTISFKSFSLLLADCDFTKGYTTSAAASMQIEYSFAAIPEPATGAALLGFAALATTLLRRRAARASS